ncbi:MAG: SGNH/GDSL hydrolase family protein [bacterium]
MTIDQIIEAKRAEGKELSVKLLEEKKKRLKHTTGIRINKDGFRGAEIEKPKIKIRIMTVGDSCTFGSLAGEHFTYPGAMQNTLLKSGYQVDVINVGIDGYGTEIVLKRLDYYLSFDPDIVTIYIGWNSLFFDEAGLNPPYKRYLTQFANNFRTISVTRKLIRKFLKMGEYGEPIELYSKNKYYNNKDKDAQRASVYYPTFFRDMEKIVERIKRNGKTPVLITLPGLFLTSQKPTEKALKMGHLPYITSNAYVLAKMVESYNDTLRSYAVENDIYLIDLEKWSLTAFNERDKWFYDSLHTTEDGMIEIGKYLAVELVPVIDKIKLPAKAH